MEDLISTTRYVTWSLHNKVNIVYLRGIQMPMKIANPTSLVLCCISNGFAFLLILAYAKYITISWILHEHE